MLPRRQRRADRPPAAARPAAVRCPVTTVPVMAQAQPITATFVDVGAASPTTAAAVGDGFPVCLISDRLSNMLYNDASTPHDRCWSGWSGWPGRCRARAAPARIPQAVERPESDSKSGIEWQGSSLPWQRSHDGACSPWRSLWYSPWCCPWASPWWPCRPSPSRSHTVASRRAGLWGLRIARAVYESYRIVKIAAVNGRRVAHVSF
jgi:hypothetical protein